MAGGVRWVGRVPDQDDYRLQVQKGRRPNRRERMRRLPKRFSGERVAEASTQVQPRFSLALHRHVAQVPVELPALSR